MIATPLERLRSQLASLNLGAMFLRDTPSIQWVTQFAGVFDEERAHGLYVDHEVAVLHTDSRYALACKEAAKSTSIQIDDRRISMAEFVLQMEENRRRSGLSTDPLGVEDSLTLREYGALLDKVERWGTPYQTSDLVLALRSVKDSRELDLLRRAQEITDGAFEKLLEWMAPGVTEKQVRQKLENLMFEMGADGLSFPSIVAAGPNGANPHALPSDQTLENGMAVVIDFGAAYGGYHADMTRTVFVGEPSEILKRAYAAIRKANETVEAKLAPGVTGKEAHELAEQVLADAGFGGKMGHGLGHGVGLEIHELPTLSPRNPEALVAGNVVTVEPGIYIADDFGMRLEDFGVVTETGFEVFTRCTHDMILI